MKQTSLSKIIGKDGVFIDGDWIESKDQDPKGSVRLIQLADIGEGLFINKSDRHLTTDKALALNCTFLKPGDVLIARMPDPIGRACIFPKLDVQCVTVVDVCIIRPDTKIVLPEWLMYQINAPQFRRKIQKYVTGTTRQRISRGNLEKIKFDVPPIEEQKRIIKLLNQATSLRQKRKQSIHLLDDYLQSVFMRMFSNSTKTFPTKTIEDVAEKEKSSIKAGPFGSSLKKEYYVKSGYKIYGQEQVIRNDFNFGDYYIDENKYKTLENCRIKKGDILISLVGTFGRISVVPDVFEPGIINPRLMKITLNQNIMKPIFFKELLGSFFVQSQIKNLSHGGTMDIVNVGIMKKIKIIVPDISAQEKYINLKSEVELLKQKMLSQYQELDIQFQALIQKSFQAAS